MDTGRTGNAWAGGVAALALMTAGTLQAADGGAADTGKQPPAQHDVSGSGRVAAVNVPTEWNEPAGRNILWKTPIELPAWASPIVSEGKVVALGASAEKRVVVCLNAADGKPAWTTEVTPCDGLAEEYAIESQDARWDTLLHAGATPATNGKQVFALFSNGQLVALDLASGKQAWAIAVGNPAGNSYGLCSALLVHTTTVIAVFQGDAPFVAAYDTASGKEQWKTARTAATWASPILIKTPAGKSLVVLSADPSVTAWDADTGKQAWSLDVLNGGVEHCIGPSPVYADGLVFACAKGSGIFAIDADKGTKVWGVTELPEEAPVSEFIRMVTDGRVLFHYGEYYLTALDAKTGKVIKQKELDDMANCANPVMAEGRLYLGAGSGTLVVNADPAGEFGATIGKGEIQDRTDATPAFVDGRVYLRSDEAVYAIGAE